MATYDVALRLQTIGQEAIRSALSGMRQVQDAARQISQRPTRVGIDSQQIRRTRQELEALQQQARRPIQQQVDTTQALRGIQLLQRELAGLRGQTVRIDAAQGGGGGGAAAVAAAGAASSSIGGAAAAGAASTAQLAGAVSQVAGSYQSAADAAEALLEAQRATSTQVRDFIEAQRQATAAQRAQSAAAEDTLRAQRQIAQYEREMAAGGRPAAEGQKARSVRQLANDLQGATTRLDRYQQVELEAAQAAYRLTNAQNQLQRELTQTEERAAGAAGAINRLSGAQQRAGRSPRPGGDPGQQLAPAGGFGGAIRGALQLAAAYITVQTAIQQVGAAMRSTFDRVGSEQKIRALGAAYGETGYIMSVSAQQAAKFGVSQTEANDQFATAYARLRPLGLGLAEITSIYEGFNTAARISGATAAESSASFTQLLQGIGSGALRGDELRSVLEQAPALSQALAKELDTTVGGLKKLGEQGKITSDIVLRALERVRVDGAERLAASLNTPQNKLDRLGAAWQDFQATVGTLTLPVVLPGIDVLTRTIKDGTADVRLWTQYFGVLPRILNENATAMGGVAREANALGASKAAVAVQALINPLGLVTTKLTEIIALSPQARDSLINAAKLAAAAWKLVTNPMGFAVDRLRDMRDEQLKGKTLANPLNLNDGMAGKSWPAGVPLPGSVPGAKPYVPPKPPAEDTSAKDAAAALALANKLADEARSLEQQLARNRIDMDQQVFNIRAQRLRQLYDLEKQLIDKQRSNWELAFTGAGRQQAQLINGLLGNNSGYQEKISELREQISAAQQDVKAAKAGINVAKLGQDPIMYNPPSAKKAAAAAGSGAFPVIEYLTGDRSSANYRADHGGGNYHDHLAFATRAARDAAMAALRANGIRIGSVNDGRHTAGSNHYKDLAFDVPGAQVPVGQEPALSARVRSILGMGGAVAKGAPAAGAGGVQVGLTGADQVAAATAKYEQSKKALEGLNQQLQTYTTSVAALQAQDVENFILQSTDAFRTETAALKASTEQLDLRNMLEAKGMTSGFVDAEVAKLNVSQQLAERLAALKIAYEDGIITQDKYTESAQRLAEAASGQAGAIDRNAVSVRQAEQRQQARGDAESLSGGITSGVKGLLTGTDPRAALQQMLEDLSSRLLDIALRPLQDALTQQFTQMLSPQKIATDLNTMALQQLTVTLSASSIGGAAQSIGGLGSLLGGGGFGSWLGGAFGIGGIPDFAGPFLASGGIATSPTLAMIGEGGEPEAVVPLSQLGTMMGDAGGAAPVINQNINIDNNGNGSITGNDASRFGRIMQQVAIETIRQEQRPGGSLGRRMS